MKCDICGESNAEYRCQECGMYYCGSCNSGICEECAPPTIRIKPKKDKSRKAPDSL